MATSFMTNHIMCLLCEKLESLQYKAALAITGVIQGTPRNKIYEELGIESLKSRGWHRRLSCMFKIMKEEAPNCRYSHIPIFHCRTHCFKYSFFPSTLKDWFSKVGYCRLFVQYKTVYSIFLIQKS